MDLGPSAVNWGSKFVDMGPYDLIPGLRGISDATGEVGSTTALVMVVLVEKEIVAASETAVDDINNSAPCDSIDNDSTRSINVSLRTSSSK